MNFDPPTAEEARVALDEMERHSLMPAGRALIVSEYIEMDADSKAEFRKDPQVVAWLVLFGWSNMKLTTRAQQRAFDALNKKYDLGVIPQLGGELAK